FCQEHQIRPRRFTDAARISLVLWSRLFDWKEALVIVQPETLIRWHRKGFKLFWRGKSKPGRPRLPHNLRDLIAQMVHQNPTWGPERIASEPSHRGRTGEPERHPRRTGRPNHARSILACDFWLR